MAQQGIYARFSPAELAKLQSKAEEAGMTQSAFVRASALQALKQGDLEKAIAVAVQAEAKTAWDWFLDNYSEAQASTADAMSHVLSGIMTTTKQVIAPRTKEDAEAEALRMMSPQDRVNYERLKARNANASPHRVPSGDESEVYAYTSAPRRK